MKASTVLTALLWTNVFMAVVMVVAVGTYVRCAKRDPTSAGAYVWQRVTTIACVLYVVTTLVLVLLAP